MGSGWYLGGIKSKNVQVNFKTLEKNKKIKKCMEKLNYLYKISFSKILI